MRRDQSGLTLLELLITIALAAVLIGIGIPSFQRALETARAGQWTRDISSFISLARVEALQRGACVIIEPSGVDWSTEWLLGADLDGDDSLDANEVLHRMQGIDATDFEMTDGNDADLDALYFDQSGWPSSGGGPGGGNCGTSLAAPVSFAFQPDGCTDPDSNRRAMTMLRSGGMAPAVKQVCT